MSKHLKIVSLEYQGFTGSKRKRTAFIQYETAVGRHGSEQFRIKKEFNLGGANEGSASEWNGVKVSEQQSASEWNGLKVTEQQREANVLARTLRGKLKKKKNRDSKAATKLNEFKSSRQ